MAKLPWTPWHEVVELRDDLRRGELPLAEFAADLHDVAIGRARPIYQDPAEFFALTYPTFNLRELAKDVVGRLAGRNAKAVRQLELTYGGGKTHTLVTLHHLVRDPDALPDLPSVREFVEHCGMTPPGARVVVLPFDKLDVEKGMEARAPDGTVRWLRQPWSVLAWQIAGPEGLSLLHPEGKPDERDSAPAQNLIEPLLARPADDGLATLVLIDEVLMYAREKVGLEPAWRSRLVNFFQYLTQAAVKVERCAVVASLLATDPEKADDLGKEIIGALYDVFRREREEGVQPVLKEDVAEVLRRRFFTQKSVDDRARFRAHVVAGLKGIGDLDEKTRREGPHAEERFVASYPFHPDLTEVFYTKWTQLDGFQRTRGILRTFALALRAAETWDDSPFVGPNVFLPAPDDEGISEAARELTTVAATDHHEGRRQQWSAILEGELSKARSIEEHEVPGLRHRELEQAVVATFLHSQPIGSKASTRELLGLVGATRPDRIDLEKGLLAWANVSWFLDEAELGEFDPEAGAELPKHWRLGSKPNLRQMHHEACDRVSADAVETVLLERSGKHRNLTAGAAGLGAQVHGLPIHPRDVPDDGEFRYAVLGPKAASESGKPSPEAVRYLAETTAADRPRVHRNALVLLCPSREGLEILRRRIREWLGWQEVQAQLEGHDVDPIRSAALSGHLRDADRRVADAVQQGWCIVVTMSEKGDPQAFRLSVEDGPLFVQIKNDPRARIQETAVTAETLLPGGPYELWREEEPSRWVKDLVGAFAQQPHLPKMLDRRAILDTLVQGCRDGRFVLKLTRPDRTVRTWWREAPDETALRDPALEAVLPELAELARIAPELLPPSVLPELWSEDSLEFRGLCDYFSGDRVVRVAQELSSGDLFEEPMTVPRAPRAAVEEAVRAAVGNRTLWLVAGPASLLGEEIPTGVLGDAARLRAPPAPIPVADLLPENLPDAWRDGQTTALGIATALSNKATAPVPWLRVREAIDGAIHGRFIAVAEGSAEWPAPIAAAGAVHLRLVEGAPLPPREPSRPAAPEGALVAEAELDPSQVQDLVDQMPELLRLAAGLELKLSLRVELEKGAEASAETREELNRILSSVDEKLSFE